DLAFLLQVWRDADRHLLFDQPGPVDATCWAQKGARVVKFSRGPGEIEEWARDGLQEKYPGIRLADVWVLTFGHGNTPTAERARSGWQYGTWEVAIGCAVLGAGAVLACRRLGRGAAPVTARAPRPR